MWDEKKFFEDFVKENEEIKPSEKFVENLKQLDKVKNIEALKHKKVVRHSLRYASVAAAIVVFLVAGGIAFLIKGMGNGAENSGGTNIDIPLHGGNDENTWGEDGDSESPEVADKLEKSIELIDNEAVSVLDKEGNELCNEDRAALKSKLLNATKTNEITGVFGEYEEYTIMGNEEISIKIYFEQYILIGKTEMYCIEGE